nr:cleavage stimulation factor subunit 77 [Ipomoea batatas]
MLQVDYGLLIPSIESPPFLNIYTPHILVQQWRTRLPIAEAVPIYEQLLSTFPTAAKYWKQYVEAHMAVNNDDATKQIFSRCLLNCLQIPLWRCYIRFIRKVNDKRGTDGQEETKKAYEFMLNYVGADIASGPVWMEYIAYLKSLPALTAQDESQRMTAVRKAYQRAIVTPTHHVEQLWRDYENFENSISRALAKGLISEYQPKYNSAKAVYREMKKYIDEIDWNMLAVPPSETKKKKIIKLGGLNVPECTDVHIYLKYTDYIKSKFLAFEKIDTASANKRIVFAYEQCLMYLYHYPDIWYDYATWHAKCGSVDSAIKVYQRSLKALPDSEMLRYAYAELEESRGAIQAAKKVYESLMGDGTNATALSLIQFIRFLRRTEGVEAARKYFLDARKSPNCTYHVYVAQAMMEFCLNKDAKVARNVFEAGLKNFMHEPEYILEYADFLSRLNDDINIRALFERALSSLPPEESLEVWKRFSQFEQIYGDLASMLKVEQRRKEALSRTEKSKEHWLLSKTFESLCTLPYSGIQLNSNGGQPPNVLGDVLKSLPPALAAFISNLPAVEGPSPDTDFVISVCLQSNIPSVTGKPGVVSHPAQSGSVPSTSDLSDSSKFKTRDRLPGKRKNMDRQDDDDTSTVQSQPLPRDLFKIRQLHKSRVSSSHTGSVSYGSAISGELSGSTS